LVGEHGVHSSREKVIAEWIDANLAEAITVLTLPPEHRRRLRTSNAIEQLKKENKRRTRVATLLPNADSLLRLVSAILADLGVGEPVLAGDIGRSRLAPCSSWDHVEDDAGLAPCDPSLDVVENAGDGFLVSWHEATFRPTIVRPNGAEDASIVLYGATLLPAPGWFAQLEQGCSQEMSQPLAGESE
jgi:hypothetical protein